MPIIRIALVLILVVVGSEAGEAAPDGLDACVQSALAASPELKHLDQAAASAAAVVIDAGAWSNPELRLGRQFPARTKADDPLVETAVRWWMPRPGAGADERAIATGDSEELRQRAAKARNDLAARVRDAYLAAAQQSRLITRQESALAREKQRTAIVEQLITLGRRTAVDRTDCALRRLAAEAELDRQRRVQDAAVAELRTLVGRPPPRPLPPPAIALPAGDLTQLRTVAHACRAELAGAHAALVTAQAQRALAARRADPWLTFTEVGWSPLGDGGNDFSVRLGVELTILDRHIGVRRAGEIAVEEILVGIKLASARIDAEVEAAWQALVAAQTAEVAYRARGDGLVADIAGIKAGLAAQDGDPLAVLALEAGRDDIERTRASLSSEVLRARNALRSALGLDSAPPVEGAFRP